MLSLMQEARDKRPSFQTFASAISPAELGRPGESARTTCLPLPKMLRQGGVGMDERFIRAVEAIYEAAPDPSVWPQALQLIADVFDDVGTVLLWHRDDGSIGTIASPALAAAQADYQQGWSTRDIRSKRAVERLIWVRGETMTERHFMTPDELDTEPFYTEFLARHGLRYCVGTGISPDPHVAVGLSVQRSVGKPEYTDAEVELMARIGRHAEKSLRLSIRLLDAQLSNLGLGDALGRIGIGVITLDSIGRVIFANPVAERLSGQELQIEDGRLKIGSGARRSEIDAVISHALRGDHAAITAEPKPILVQRTSSDRPLVVYVLPLPASAKVTEQFLTHTRAIVLVIDATTSDPPDPAVVRDVLGLTLGEARLASLVGSGLAPREAAQRLGITEETARTALKRVFSKIGVSRQSELAVLLTKLVLR